MENLFKQSLAPPGWKKSCLWLVLAAACFHAAYTSLKYPAAGLFIFGYAYGLVRLMNQPNVRRAFYFGLMAGYLCYAPQSFFMWNIFGPLAFVLWLVLAFWIGLFTAIACGAIRRWGMLKAAWLIPILWTGIEYFRSELYYLKFSWLNIGYLAQDKFSSVYLGAYGMFGLGFLIMAVCTALFYLLAFEKKSLPVYLFLAVGVVLHLNYLSPHQRSSFSGAGSVSLVGIQLEFPNEAILPKILNQALAKNTNAPIFVLSEYTLDGGVPDSLKDWCRTNSRYLIVGGKDVLTNNNYYNTAFVVGTNGDVVFQQVKSVPIQFFRDGLPAPKQEVWDSPWGKIGICICYDLSYTRVTDRLVEQGAQLIICPTMDVENWGVHQHELHSRVAPVRASEYGIPVFRVASSGISQAVNGYGHVVAQTKIPGAGEIMAAQLSLVRHAKLPLDRTLAPVCVFGTGAILVALLFLDWKEKRKQSSS